MRGYLFDDYQVEIDPRAVELGGSWQGAPRNGLPTAWDGDLLKFFYERMPDGCRFLDVGANTGSYCLLCALRPDSYCLAFEPYPDVREILRANITLNGLEGQVGIFDYALGEYNGWAELCLPGGGASGLACLAEVPTRFTPVRRIAVDVRRMDVLIWGQIDMVKIDVEGAELLVLRGAADALRHCHPALLIEYDERNVAAFGYEREEIITFLRDVGYTQFTRLGPDGRDLWAT